PGIQHQGIHDSGPSAVERGGSLPDPGLEPLWERGATGDGAAPLDQEQTLGPDPRLGILDPPSGYPNAGSGCISGADRPANRDDAMAPSPNRRGQTYSPVLGDRLLQDHRHIHSDTGQQCRTAEPILPLGERARSAPERRCETPEPE